MTAVMNLGSIIANAARRHPNRVGLVQGGSVWSWSELDRNVDALAHALVGLGLGPGDRVMVQCPNSRYLFECMYAIVKTGAVYVPINARSTVVETLDMALLCDAKAFIVDSGCAKNGVAVEAADNDVGHIIFTDELPSSGDNSIDTGNWWRYDELVAANDNKPFDAAAVVYDDICWHSFTSGTTGTPKGAMMRMARTARKARSICTAKCCSRFKLTTCGGPTGITCWATA